MKLPLRRKFGLSASIATATATTLMLLALPAQAPASDAYEDLSYDLDSPVPDPSFNALDLYTPDGAAAGDDRPVVVFVHGGGWRIGDKANKIADKANLFTGAGYVFASVNYRLSPAVAEGEQPPPDRIRFPAHPHDVGEAIGWLDQNVAGYGGDPTRIVLIGHSAGAQIVSLVATDPSYLSAYGVEPWQVIGAVSLDTDAFDITQQATQPAGQNRDLIWNAFGTPEENAIDGSWLAGSATNWASADDADFLFVTSTRPPRIASNREMAEALGQDPDGVVVTPYDHEGINNALGDPADNSNETPSVITFVSGVIDGAVDPKVRFDKHPRAKVKTRERTAEVRFRYSSKIRDVSFECKLDRAEFKPCKSKRALDVETGDHVFKVKARTDRGRPGPVKGFEFKVKRDTKA